MTTTVPQAAAPTGGAVTGRRLEPAQAVWHAAVDLAAGRADGGAGEPGVVLALLRSADLDPSTLRHALALGRTLLRREPQDARLRGGVQLLGQAADWLGARGPDGEVGAARADLRR